jgi:hypothetical protein
MERLTAVVSRQQFPAMASFVLRFDMGLFLLCIRVQRAVITTKDDCYHEKSVLIAKLTMVMYLLRSVCEQIHRGRGGPSASPAVNRQMSAQTTWISTRTRLLG